MENGTKLIKVHRSLSTVDHEDKGEIRQVQVLVNRYFFEYKKDHEKKVYIELGVTPLESQKIENSQNLSKQYSKNRLLINVLENDLGIFKSHSETLFNHIQIKNSIYFFSIKESEVLLNLVDLSNENYDVKDS